MQSLKRGRFGATAVFVFAVRSTGIYCRPSLSARRPKREQVSFFRVPEAQSKRGSRVQAMSSAARERDDPQIELVRQVCHVIDGTRKRPQRWKA